MQELSRGPIHLGESKTGPKLDPEACSEEEKGHAQQGN